MPLPRRRCRPVAAHAASGYPAVPRRLSPRMRALFAPLCLLSLLALPACGGSRKGSLVPPPESGTVTIDMDGTWAVADIERRDSTAPLPTPIPIAAPFFPLAPGQLVSIAQGQAYGYDAEPLFLNWGAGVPNERYTNVADGRTWLFDMAGRQVTDCVQALAVRAAFGAVDDDTMLGYVEVQFATDCPSGTFLNLNPNGLFTVRLVRVAIQAAAGR